MAIPVDIPESFPVYCDDVTYTGSTQKLTKEGPTNVTFLDNEQINAGEYTVKAHINAPLYIWKDGTFEDKEFKCTMKMNIEKT